MKVDDDIEEIEDAAPTQAVASLVFAGFRTISCVLLEETRRAATIKHVHV